MALVLTLTAMVLGVMATLYGFAMSRLAHATATFATTSDAVWAADVIEATVRDSSSCSIVSVSGRSCLKCVLPLTETDRDSDGFADRYNPLGVTRRGWEKWGNSGKRIWFYQGSEAGTPSSTGTILFRAKRSDDTTPSGSDIDNEFTYATDARLRRPLISNFTASVNSSNRTVTFTISTSSLTRDERSHGTESSNNYYTHSETRTVAWRNGIK